MKRRIGISMVCALLGCTCVLSGAAASAGYDADSEKWDMLIANFDPLDEDHIAETPPNAEEFVEPKISAELAKAMEEAHPLSIVSYDPRTGEVTLTPYPYAAPGETGVTETPPSQPVSE